MDPSPSVQIATAEVLCQFDAFPLARPILARYVRDDRPWLALQAARAIFLIGEKAAPLEPVIREVLEKYRAEPGGRLKYKDFNFAAFISWSLEWALKNIEKA